MTGEKGATAEMPGVEEIARIICRRVHEALFPNAEDWRPGELERKVDIYWPHYTREARAILALFAPILAEKEREIEHFAALAFDDLGKNPPVAWRDRALAAEAALKLVAEQDVTEIALDPDWPRRICAAAIRTQSDKPA